jgi:hypothetical protein
VLYKALVIAKNTFTETLRQPVFCVIIFFAILLFIISPSIAMYTMDEDVKMLREIGLSTLFLAGLFISVFSATGAVYDEIENKTITTVLSKPVPRPIFIIGKFLGVVLAVAIGHYILTTAYMLSVRHGVLETASDTHDWPVIIAAVTAIGLAVLVTAFLNYAYDWPFTSTSIVLLAVFSAFSLIFLFFIDRDFRFAPAQSGFEMFDVYASALLLLAVMVIVALAVMFSTRFNVILTLILCIGVFLLGLISDYLFGRFADEHFWAKAGKILVPNLQVFWISDAIYDKSLLKPIYLLTGGLYALLYTTGILFIATSLFQRRQVG